MGAPIEAVRGMRDVLPDDHRELARVRAQLETLLDRHGYLRLDLPVIEQRDLYSRKLGEELVGKVYEFEFGGRHLALRPEWTASVLRAYVSHMQDQPLPLRLSYSGPVFRYERPQRHTHRQFTQIGVELVGGPSPRADAEVLALACAGLEAAGVRDYRLVVGHIGLVREALQRLGLAERTQGLLVWSLERMRNQGVAAVQARLAEFEGDLPLDPELLQGLDDAQASALLIHLIRAMQLDLAFGTRPPEAIVGRLLRKLRRDDDQPRIERALDLLGKLCLVRGPAVEALPQARDLLAAAGLTTAALDELHAILELFAAHKPPGDHVILDFGLGRGLHYYTGLIFEIYDAAGELQLCGGGRYDDLVLNLGARQAAPAAGFAYGLERVVAAATPPPAPAGRMVLVAPVTDDDYAYGLEVARRLRERGFTVTVDVRGRTIAGNLRDAARRAIPYVVIVGAEERAGGEVVWRDLAAREERRIALSELDAMTGWPRAGESDRVTG